MNVRIHIDRLVIDGLDVPAGSGSTLRTAVERELARLVSTGGLASALTGGIAVPSVKAPEIDGVGTPANIGRAIGRAVYGGIGLPSTPQNGKAR